MSANNYNITNQLGFLQMSSDTGAILTSGGDLQNDENTAKLLYNIVKSCANLEKFKTISLNFQSCCYIVVLSGNKIHAVKKESHSDL